VRPPGPVAADGTPADAPRPATSPPAHGQLPGVGHPDDVADPDGLSHPDAAGDAADAADVAARFRAGALGTVSAAYATAHGHPVGADLDQPAGRRRWAVTARAAALVLAVLLSVGAAVVTVAVSRGGGMPTGRVAAAVDVPTPRAPTGGDGPEATPSPGGGSATSGPSAGVVSGGSILVHVVGAVRRPGLVHLASGARLEDAVEAAGGPTSSAQLDAVNLAGVVTDGQQVRVPRRGESLAPSSDASSATGTDRAGAASGAAGAAGAPVDLNTADVAALDALPGIGPVLAQRIVDRRTQSGRFTSVDQLDEVAGIGPAMLARLRDLVRV